MAAKKEAKTTATMTKAVAGGVYEARDGSRTYTAVMTAVVTSKVGTSGVLQRVGYAPETLAEGSDSLNAWTLVYDPSAPIANKD